MINLFFGFGIFIVGKHQTVGENSVLTIAQRPPPARRQHGEFNYPQPRQPSGKLKIESHFTFTLTKHGNVIFRQQFSLPRVGRQFQVIFLSACQVVSGDFHRFNVAGRGKRYLAQPVTGFRRKFQRRAGSHQRNQRNSYFRLFIGKSEGVAIGAHVFKQTGQGDFLGAQTGKVDQKIKTAQLQAAGIGGKNLQYFLGSRINRDGRAHWNASFPGFLIHKSQQIEKNAGNRPSKLLLSSTILENHFEKTVAFIMEGIITALIYPFQIDAVVGFQIFRPLFTIEAYPLFHPCQPVPDNG